MKPSDLKKIIGEEVNGVLKQIRKSVNEAKQPKEKDLSIINKARAKAALRQIKKGKRDDGMGKFTDRLFGVTTSGEVQQISNEKDINMYNKFGLAESVVNEGKKSKIVVKKSSLGKYDGSKELMNKAYTAFVDGYVKSHKELKWTTLSDADYQISTIYKIPSEESKSHQNAARWLIDKGYLDLKESVNEVATLGASKAMRIGRKLGWDVKKKASGRTDYVTFTKDGKKYGPVDANALTQTLLMKKLTESKLTEAEFKHINRDEHKIKLAIKDVEKKSRLKANRDKTPEYEQIALNKIMLSKVLGREKLSSKYKAAWIKLKKEYSLKESKMVKKNKKLTEASRGKVYKAVKKGSYPVTIVVISNGMVIKQELAKTPEVVPALFNTLQKQYPNANLSIEDKTGKRLFSESVNEGKNAQETIIDGLKLSFQTFFEAGVESDYKMFEKFWKRDYKDLVNAAAKIKVSMGESVNEGSPGYSKFIFSLQTLIGDIAPNAWEDKSQIDSTSMKRIHNSLKKRYGDDYAKYNDLLKTQKGQFGNWYLKESVNEAKLITEYSDQEILDMLLKSKAMAKKDKRSGLVKSLHKHIKDLEQKIKQAKKESVNEADYKDVSNKFKKALDNLPDKAFTTKNIEKLIQTTKEKRPDAAMAYAKAAFGWLMKEGKLTEIRKGDYVNSGTEVGLVNKVSGQVAYVKFDSRPKSFHPILIRNLTKTGKKHKGKDLYEEGIVNEAMSFHKILQKLVKNMSSNAYANFADEHLNDPNDANEMQEFIEDTTKAEAIHFAKEIKKGLYEGKINESVKPIKLSGNLKKDLDNVTHMATKMVKYAKDNFNTYIPTGHMLSQLTVAGYKEKDVLKYNIAHLAKAINTDLKKKYMKDFVAESVNEGSRKKVTKSMWQKMSDDEKENALLTVFEDPDTAQKWIGRKWNSLPGSVARDMYTESVGKPKVNERFKHNDMYAMLDIAAGYSSTQHQAANQMWSDEQDLYDYLKSDHIPKKYHKDFYNDVKRRFKGVNESVTEGGDYKDVSNKFKKTLDNLPDKAFTTKNIEKLIKATKEKRPDAAMAYAKSAFGWLMKEGKVNEGLSSSDIRKATDTIKKYVKKLGSKADGEVDVVAGNIADILRWDDKKRAQLADYLLDLNSGSEEIIFGA